MKSKRYYPAPDVQLKASFEGTNKNLGDCRNVTYTGMYNRYRHVYKDHYTDWYTDWELKKIHDRWRRITAEL